MLRALTEKEVKQRRMMDERLANRKLPPIEVRDIGFAAYDEVPIKAYNYDEYQPMWLGQGSAHSISDHKTRDDVEELRLSVEEITGKPVKRDSFGFIR